MPNRATAPSAPLPPGPPPRRGGLLANAAYYGRFLLDPLGFVGGRFAQFGDIYCAQNPDGRLYVLRRPEHVREVLSTRAADFGKSHSAFANLAEVLGHGLVTAEGELWRTHRRMIQPAFSRASLAAYGERMVGEAARSADRWNDGAEIDLSREMMELTLQIVSRSLFGHDPSDSVDDIANAMATLRSSLGRPPLLPSFLPSIARSRRDRAIANLDRFIYRLIEQRRSAGAPAAKQPGDLLDRLLAATDDEEEQRLTDREVRDELVTFYLAGHETTSHALTWTFYLLSRHPEIEAELHRHVDRVLEDRLPTASDRPALGYAEQVFKEAMRLYPPAYVLARRAERNTQIGDFPVPEGSEVTAWIYFTHRTEEVFPDPERFDPARFAPEREAEIPKMAYMPFGGGPRACIGKQFALLEGTLLLATLSRRFRFHLLPGQHVTPHARVTLAPRREVRMRVERRR